MYFSRDRMKPAGKKLAHLPSHIFTNFVISIIQPIWNLAASLFVDNDNANIQIVAVD